MYMDDITTHTKPNPKESEEQHITQHEKLVHHILNKLEENDLYLKPEKCEFLKRELDYLGIIVGNGTLKMDPKKLQGVADQVTPQTPLKSGNSQDSPAITDTLCYTWSLECCDCLIEAL